MSSISFKASIQKQEQSFWETYRHKKILIVGFSLLTGYSLAKIFNQKKIYYSIYDQKINQKLKKKIQSKKNYCIDFLGKLTKNQILKFDDILLSPGIPRSEPFLRQAVANGIKVWNDFDFLYPIYKDKIIIGVTGTDGKTTVVKWLNFFFQKNKSDVYLCGNVGIPIASNYSKLLSAKIIILELSSYMLEDVKQFRANCSVITNIDKDHLNRYQNFQKYFETKINIIKNSLSSDFFLWSQDDPILQKINPQKFNCQFLPFSMSKKNGFYYEQEKINFNQEILTKKIKLKNNFLNLYNFLIVFIISFLYQKKNQNISLLTKFIGLEHRLEKVNWQIYNDSKATTVQAISFAIASLKKNFKKKKINLILGGRNKNLDFTTLKKYNKFINKIYIYGESSNEIFQQIKTIFNCKLIEKFNTCINLAFEELTEENILLLSPGCASQDQFKNYMERGNLFKQQAKRFFKIK